MTETRSAMETSLLYELRQYLMDTHQPPSNCSNPRCAELRSDLALAAKVGQSLFTQLRHAEDRFMSAEQEHEKELSSLRRANSRLLLENAELESEQEHLYLSLRKHDDEIKELHSELNVAKREAARFRRAMDSARALEEQVSMLEQMHEAMQRELERDNVRSKLSGSHFTELAAENLAHKVHRMTADLASTSNSDPDETLVDDSSVSQSSPAPTKPRLQRSLSHESVLAPMAEEPVDDASIQKPHTSKAVAGLSGHSATAKPLSRYPTNAREHLLSNVKRHSQAERWSFVPFRRQARMA